MHRVDGMRMQRHPLLLLLLQSGLLLFFPVPLRLGHNPVALPLLQLRLLLRVASAMPECACKAISSCCCQSSTACTGGCSVGNCGRVGIANGFRDGSERCCDIRHLPLLALLQLQYIALELRQRRQRR